MLSLLSAGAGAAAAGLVAAYAYRQFRPTILNENAATPAHWSQAQPDRTGNVLRAAAALVVAYGALEGLAICSRGLADESTQRAAALQTALLLSNVYSLFEIRAALALRQRYFHLEKDPPPGWPPVKCAIVWRVLAADSVALFATASVEALHENWTAAAWRVALLLGMYWVVASNPLPFYTT